MLVDPIIKENSLISYINSFCGDGEQKRIQKGIYVWKDLDSFLQLKYENNYPDMPDDLPYCYGVCDTMEQFMERYLEKLENSKYNFCITFWHIEKHPDNKGLGGGWRWHKWGDYIGDGIPACEYLDDEDGFHNGVYIYHIYEIPEDQIKK